jgi:hypothetical protein
MKKTITRYGIIVAALCSIYGCKQRSHSADTSDEQAIKEVTASDNASKVTAADELIVPGKGIGKILLKGSADSAAARLGKPDYSDAAMGSVLMTWYAKHDTSGYKTSLFADHNFGAKDESIAHIRKILITSPAFKTAEGLKTGLALNEYQKHFDLKPISGYTVKGKKVKVYEAKHKGIAFEIDSASNKGVAIVVHQPNDSLATYINLH